MVRAGLLGGLVHVADGCWRAEWTDATGSAFSKEFPYPGEAAAHVARWQDGELRFHDLRHSYATWLVSAGVPINDVQRIMGHEKATTTLDLYTHGSPDRDERVRGVFADFLLTEVPKDDPEDGESPSGDGL